MECCEGLSGKDSGQSFHTVIHTRSLSVAHTLTHSLIEMNGIQASLVTLMQCHSIKWACTLPLALARDVHICTHYAREILHLANWIQND